MSQDTPYYELIHGENGISPTIVRTIYMQIARLVSAEINNNRGENMVPDKSPDTETILYQELDVDLDDPRQVPELAFEMRDTLLRQLFGADGFSNFYGDVFLFEKRFPAFHECADRYQARIYTLIDTLSKQIDVCLKYKQNTENYNTITASIQETLDKIKTTPFGLQIIHVVGYMYSAKAAEFLKSQSVTRRLFSKLKGKRKLTEGTKNHRQALKVMDGLYKQLQRLQEFYDHERSILQSPSAETIREFIDNKRKQEQNVLSQFLKLVWIGLQSEIQSVLEEVCTVILEGNNSSQQLTPQELATQAQELERIGILLQKTYMRSSRRKVSFFYWDVAMDMGIDIYRQGGRYARNPDKITAKTGQRLYPDGAIFEYIEYGVGDGVNLFDYATFIANDDSNGTDTGADERRGSNATVNGDVNGDTHRHINRVDSSGWMD